MIEGTRAGEESHPFGFDAARVERWLAHVGNPDARRFSGLVGALHYHRMPRDLFKSVPPHLDLDENARQHFESLWMDDRKYIDLKMLLHDWSNDPLFFDDSEAQRRIAVAQQVAVAEVMGWRGQDGIQHRRANDVMWRFLADSGIYERVMVAFGLSEVRS
jgi:hypothetical protein